jgi:hypothetical protein
VTRTKNMKRAKAKKTLDQNKKAERLRGAARVQRVRELLAEGKSMRAIGENLAWDEGTIRRDVKKLRLPPEQLDAILNGETSEQFLAQERRRREEDRQQQELRLAYETQQQRRREEALDGRHSDAVAGEVLDGLQSLPLAQADEQHIGDHLDAKIDAAMNGRRGDLIRSPASDLRRFFTTDAWTSAPGEAGQWVEVCFDNTVRAVLAGAPEQSIRDNSVKKIAKGLRERGRRPTPVGTQYGRPFGVNIIRPEPRTVYARSRNGR